MRIVHTGDMHFDSPYISLPPSVAQRRKAEQEETFIRIINAVRELRADMLLLAGDVFDSRFVSPATVTFLKDAFSAIADTPVLIAPGNHDFLSPDSPYKTIDFGENVHVFTETLSALHIGEATVYGCGFPSRYVKTGLLPKKRLHSEVGTGILLMHGDIGTESDYNPIAEATLAETGISYAALGHVHTFSGFLKAGKTCYAYPGIPEGRHFDESARGGYICGEVTQDGADLSFVEVGKRQNITITVDTTGMETVSEVLQAIRRQLEKENLYKIVLTGQRSQMLYLDTKQLSKAACEDCFFAKVQDATAEMGTGSEESLLEKMFTERLSLREDEIARRALQLGRAALGRQNI